MFTQAEIIAKQAFSEITRQFPHLTVRENKDHPVELSLTIPEQDGLKHEVWLGFQNADELHFSVGHFWLEWFPCTESEKVRSFVDAVSGFLHGQYRVLEHHRGTNCIKAELQRPSSDGWETIGTWSRLHLPSFQKVAFKVVINA